MGAKTKNDRQAPAGADFGELSRAADALQRRQPKLCRPCRDFWGPVAGLSHDESCGYRLSPKGLENSDREWSVPARREWPVASCEEDRRWILALKGTDANSAIGQALPGDGLVLIDCVNAAGIGRVLGPLISVMRIREPTSLKNCAIHVQARTKQKRNVL